MPVRYSSAISFPFRLAADASLNGVGEIAADYLARGLIESGLADAVGAFGQETTTDARSVRGVFRRGLGGERSEAVNLGAGTLVEGAVYRVGDSLRYEARVIDARDGTLLRSIDPVRASLVSLISSTARPLGPTSTISRSKS